MPITLITGPANAGKAQVVMDAVRVHLARGEDPLLVVPTRADVEHYRRELAGEGAVLGARVERFDGLVAEAVARARAEKPLLGDLARERLLASISREPLGAGPGHVRALGDFFAEVQARRIGAGRLTQALSAWAGQGRERSPAARAGELFGSYERRLSELGRTDREQRTVRALDALRRRPALWGGTPVLFYGFDDFQVLQLDAIETLGVVVGAEVTVSLTFEPGRMAFAGRAGTFHALAPLAHEHRALAPRADYYAENARQALSHLERSLFEPEAGRVPAGRALRLLEGGDERSELELVAGQISGLLEGGMPAEEIAVVLRHTEGTGELVAEVLGAAGIPHTLERRRRLSDTAVGRALLGLLRCVPAAPGESAPGELGDLLAWLRAPGVLEHPELADRLERDARRTGVTGADRARAMWEERHWPIERVEQLGAARGGRALIERAAAELDRLFAAPRRRSAGLLGGEELDEGRALAAGRRALAELAELVRLAPELGSRSAGELAEVLAGVDFLSGEHSREGAVAVLEPLELRARRVRALFLCGLQEGVFPALAPSPALLGEDERADLAETTGLRLGEHADGLDAERYLLYATVSRPTDLLSLSWHAAGEDGRASVPSLFLEDVCDLFDEELRDSASRRAAGAVGASEVRGAGEAGPMSEAGDAGGMSEAGGTGGARDVDAGRPAERFRTGPRLSDAELLGELRARTWSASSLSTWIGCPVRWFVEKLLGGEDLEPTAEPLARGGLAHAVLSDTIAGLREQTGSGVLRRGNVALARELMERSLDEHEAEFPLSVAPERRPGVRRRLHADLTRYLENAAECSEQAEEPLAGAPFEPTYLELGFGFGGEDGVQDGLPALELADGVRLRGRIDRVDVRSGAEALVYDYKSGRAPLPTQWVAGGDLQIALYARAVEQLLGLRSVGGFYQPLSGKDLRPRGVIERDSAPEIECVRGDRREPEEVSALLEEVTALAVGAAREAGAGALEPRPGTCAFRGGCLHPTICRCER